MHRSTMIATWRHECRRQVGARCDHLPGDGTHGAWIHELQTLRRSENVTKKKSRKINEIQESRCQEPAHKRQLTSTVHATPLMTPTTALGLSICLSLFELRETGDWDIFLGPPERARAGGADQWVLKRRECSGFARVKKVTSASLGYPLSVFNKNSTLKEIYQN